MSIWVDKYKPKSTNEILGQRQNIARIKTWLKNFEASRSPPLFIYGPPGIGKTTAAHLCCKECGYSTVEFNASDQRNKNIIKEVISTISSTSRLNFFGRASETKDAIILDEVDGMAGNEDRGGIAQLILEIKKTKKPMIFICNDGQHQKLRSLKDKCENIEFRRPEVETIRQLVSKIAGAESLKVDKIDVKSLAESSDFDLRQIVNSLSLFKDGDSTQISKTTRLNAFEATRKVLTASGKRSIESRFDCFFADYNIMPLFMFENYAKNRPVKGDHLQAVSRAADCFCLSDLADKEIRTNQNWSLLNTQGLLSTVIPSRLVESQQPGRADFPQFLGKLSNANKRLRLTQELNAHMCLSVRGGLDADYLDAFRERLSAPLMAKEKLGGIDAVIDFMHDYSLLKDDLNSIMELATWSFKPDPMQKVDSKTKTALTNAYKKRAIAMPYFVDDRPVKKRKPVGFGGENEDDIEDDEEEEEEIKIKPKKVTKIADAPPAKKRAGKAPEKPKEEKKPTEKKPTEKKAAEKKVTKKKSNNKSDESDDDQLVDDGHKKPATRGRNAKKDEKKDESDSDVQVLEETKTNGKQPVADKRPPSNGIARFFQVKKQKS